MMPKASARRKPTALLREGPIQPGSPLYRMLEMIAREIAREAAGARPTASHDHTNKANVRRDR
jgi:hypothetical protein